MQAVTPVEFSGSQPYWEARYAAGGTSGRGSYDQLAAFKAQTINAFVRSHSIQSVIEYGCGDGNQLRLMGYPAYLGFDVSPGAISRCREMFAEDGSKTFKLMSDYAGERAELTLSLDVIFHLVEDDVFERYMRRLFDSSDRYVIVYSSNFDRDAAPSTPHVRHRKFSDWIGTHRPHRRLIERIPNRFPYDETTQTGSFADFYIYE